MCYKPKQVLNSLPKQWVSEGSFSAETHTWRQTIGARVNRKITELCPPTPLAISVRHPVPQGNGQEIDQMDFSQGKSFGSVNTTVA